MKIEEIESALVPLKEQLRQHELYTQLTSIADVRIFMENHVYAVWDFMSLLKGLQNQLTCTTIPWKPVENTNTARFINEIVAEEESDQNEKGQYKSHFEMYTDAMEEVGANTLPIREFLEQVSGMERIEETIDALQESHAVKDFLQFTFHVLKTNESHKIAAAFTFGREELIPDMFLKIIDRAGEEAYPKLGYYLKRHIELDGDDHGPLSLKMIQELCGDDGKKWKDVLQYSQEALQQRINLWDFIASKIKEQSLATV
ncbi:Protein of unknown function [Maribacter sedimenticola]|uniref:DUF3050 domain-containing protein n=1 Tax=Maribacter sedimenticola TaxID=228956 RepID=A0ABY1SD59_9FLAO|nr:DUF3050 domain-containing protein [Maribacter sedimenticola]SNR25741.1 Protein of unknown function [Maribacter sedimenticola]